MKAIGIDLGTTNSAAAVGGREVKVLPTRAGEQLTPSVVSFARRRRSEDGEIVVGRQAVSNAAKAPEDTIFSIKRLMGAVYGEPRVEEVKKRINYRVVDAPEGSDDQGVRIQLGPQTYSPVEISAMILRQIRGDAEQALGESVTHAVITVPAYFQERQRAATAKAGELAGLKVLSIIDEPTAAAIAFGAGREEERHRVLVYDLGGGTFDVSIIQMVGGQYQVLGISGDNWLGGDDFDQMIVGRIIDWVKREYSHDPSGDKAFLARAKEEAQKAKIALSSQQSVEVFAPLVLRLPDQGLVDIDLEVSREDFETQIEPLVGKTLSLVQQALADQNLAPADITQVLMVGGSTAVPLVQKAMTELFGEGKVKRHINPMECVALGAGILAASSPLEIGEPSEDGPEVIQVTAMHLGIAAVKGENRDAFIPIIAKGTPYPLTEPMRRAFRPTEENQSLIRVPVFEGLSEFASLNEQQGLIEFPLPEGIPSSTPVEVTFNYDRNRVLTVGVRVLGKEFEIEESLRRDRARSVQPRKADTLVDDWREELQPAVRAGRHFIDSYGQYMDAEDSRELKDAVAEGERALEANDQITGKRITMLLQNKMMGAGTASQLFIAERAMQNAPPDVTRALAEAVTRLREAHDRKDTTSLERLSSDLRLTVAQLMAQRASVRPVQDREGMGNLLRAD